MRRAALWVAVSCAILVAPPPTSAVEQVPAQEVGRAPKMDVDVWINKDEGGVYQPGESMTIYFRVNANASVIVFNIDTDGYIHLIYPYGPSDSPFIDAGRTYRIPSRSDPYELVADGPPGVEYVVAVASPAPFQNLPWYLSREMVDRGRPDGEGAGDEDPTESGHIVGDPYVGIDRIVRRIAPPGREDRIATSDTYFYIDRRVEYPRYVCADCHFHPYFFDPYFSTCSVFEVRIDATWARYAPIYPGVTRPRYIYRVRPGAPPRYRQWKEQWSSQDGAKTLRTRFRPERETKQVRGHVPSQRPVPPEFRELRRYRPGRFWKGRDEVLRVRERRVDQIRERLQRGAEEWRAKDRERSGPSEGRDRKEQKPPKVEKGEKKERERPPAREEGTVKERSHPPEQKSEGSKQREPRPTPEERKEQQRSKGR